MLLRKELLILIHPHRLFMVLNLINPFQSFVQSRSRKHAVYSGTAHTPRPQHYPRCVFGYKHHCSASLEQQLQFNSVGTFFPIFFSSALFYCGENKCTNGGQLPGVVLVFSCLSGEASRSLSGIELLMHYVIMGLTLRHFFKSF